MGQRDFLASMEMDQDFPGKETHWRHFFFLFFFFLISIAQWSVKDDDTMMSKVAKGKGKTRCKNGKSGKYTEEQDNESTDSFQNNDSMRLLRFLYQGWYLHKEKETSFFSIAYDILSSVQCKQNMAST